MKTNIFLKPLYTLFVFLIPVISFSQTEVCTIETSLGDIKIELYGDKAPKTVENFLRYVDAGLYNGSDFFRVCTAENEADRDVKIQVIQGGDIAEDKCFDAIEIETTEHTGIKHLDGVVSMARLGPNSATSSFFICIGDQPSLDYQGKRNPDGYGFAAFAKVVEGMDVVREIQMGENEGQLLLKKVEIIKISRIFRKREILPPALSWSGKSEGLLFNGDEKWLTDFEKKSFNFSPNYLQTVAWFERLALSSELISTEVIGKSPQGRDIIMVIASKDKKFHQGDTSDRSKSVLLVQSGIHSGEIDGNDAGMMLLRDIAHNGKDYLLNDNNFLFIPILNVDGHENSSEFSRPNQRGPEIMGWRTNSNNLNLNRDYTKIETPGVAAVIDLINFYNPDLYIDIHVTDGADYQYDLTFSFNKYASHSKEITNWLMEEYQPYVYEGLEKMGHIPGPFINPYKAADFSKGVTGYNLGTRFSNGYGDVRRVPSVLLENHSLKPYKQRVLGTYVFLEQSIEVLSKTFQSLRRNIDLDTKTIPNEIALSFEMSEHTTDTIMFKGVKSKMHKRGVLNLPYVEWTGEKDQVRKLPYYQANSPQNIVEIPKYFYVPVEWSQVIEKIKQHGIKYEIIQKPLSKKLTFYKADEFQMRNTPYEGRFIIQKSTLEKVELEREFQAGSLKISTDQKLGLLAVFLLESNSPDSFFKWGYFNEVLSRTEYIEGYVLEPLAKKMMAENPQLKKEFEAELKNNPKMKSSPYAIYTWFYERSDYFDKDWKIIPIGMEYADLK
jgi:cyclophilin family peptidyl-prolyl cis-trans isomerase